MQGILGNVDIQYKFYFRYLLSKVCELFKIKGLPNSVDLTYTLENLINAAKAYLE